MTGTEIDCAAIRAVGDIVASLVDPIEAANSNTEFCKYKPAPRVRHRKRSAPDGKWWWQHQPSMMTTTVRFYSAPSRIARDPRFRPATKDAVKVKVEEDWKHRGDLYGRRRI